MIERLKLSKGGIDYLLIAEADDTSAVCHMTEASHYYKINGYTCIESACKDYCEQAGLLFGAKECDLTGCDCGRITIKIGNCQ